MTWFRDRQAFWQHGHRERTRLLALFRLELEDSGRLQRSPRRPPGRPGAPPRSGGRPGTLTGPDAFEALEAMAARSFGRRRKPTRGDKYPHPPDHTRSPIVGGVVRYDLARPLLEGGNTVRDGIERVRAINERPS